MNDPRDADILAGSLGQEAGDRRQGDFSLLRSSSYGGPSGNGIRQALSSRKFMKTRGRSGHENLLCLVLIPLRFCVSAV